MSKLITSLSHDPGLTCLAFSRDGSRAYTGGQDCIVRIWKIDEGAEQEPETAAEPDNPITTVAAANECWLSGCEDSYVRIYEKHTGVFSGNLTNANAVPIRCVAVEPKGKRVAVTSDEFDVKVIDMEDPLIVSRLKGHTSGVRRATWHPTSSLLTTSGSDGNIIVWNVSGEEPKIETTIEGIIPAIGDAETPEYAHDCSAVWHTSGQYFYVASRSHEIMTVSRSDWSKSSNFSDKDVSGMVTALAISANGVYLASASQSKVHVWSTQTRRLVASQAATPGSIITQLAFSPTENLIAWTDFNGAFSRWSKPIPDTFPDPVKKSIATNAAATIPARPKTGLDLFGNDAVETTKRHAPEEEDVDLDAGFGDVDDDWIIDDLGTGLKDGPEASGRVKDGFVKEMVSITKAQPPFQPGATPMENRKRYLAYNMLGVIEVTDQDTHHIVNIDFFDRSARKSYHFTDHFKYDLGYLGERGALFACPPDSGHPAQVLYKPYGTWTSQGEWTYVLKHPGSAVLGVAAGGLPPTMSLRESKDADLQGYGNVVVATTESDLTFLSGTGRERRIVGLGADFVAMVAGPEWVFVVHRAGSTTIDGSQNLSYTMFNFDDFSVRQRDVLPLPKGHILKWIGLTDQGAPAMYDSTGRVHILTKFRIPHHASWARVMDTNLLERRQGKDESYWPVGITGSTFMCLILKGRQEYPGFPRPLIQELPMQIPFRREEPREELIERELLLIQTALDLLDEEITTDDILVRERAMDKEFILLIQAACKADNIPRAIELTKLLHNLASFDSAMKVAEFYHLIGFKEKIALLKADREEHEDRLVVARNKRRRWMKPDPPLREVQTNGNGHVKVDLLGDMRPPPPVERPRMARVTVPVIEPSRYSSAAPQALPAPREYSQVSYLDAAGSPSQASSSGEGKRKRADADDLDVSDVPTPPPPKQKSNPFARKPGLEPRNNPFGRKSDGKTIHKSESFFNKVDAAESGTSTNSKRPLAKPTNKEKGAPKQMTLAGMFPKGKEKEKEKKERGAKASSASTPSTVTEGDTETESSQVTDVLMLDASSLVIESQLVDSPFGELDDSNWEETQIVESQTQESSLEVAE
ncbi:Minichromosome loss protein 1 [Hypsizygus marmoreus]|uniref:Minichromosome loss protein 1 n=1 Tax=Hypsizygus marmoreus TaxID=39966 RepID=A0A369JB34_HYPMA|nr:Minichromosome loss protein 1 [Hypsizygus marmoreus]